MNLTTPACSQMDTCGLFRLHNDAAHALAALLDSDDLEELRSVSTASRRSSFQAIRDTKTSLLVLPAADLDRARRLLQGFDPVRLPSFQWIQIATPWHVDLLVECGLTNFVHRIRVATDDDEGPAALIEICRKLPQLTLVIKLSFADTNIVDVSPLALMPQLQDLNLSRTQVIDLSMLSSLTQLQSLVLEDSMVSNLESEEWYDANEIPALNNLANLHTLELEDCSIDSLGDLASVVSTVKKLRLRSLSSRAHAAEHHIDQELELVRQLTRVETIDVASSLLGLVAKPIYLAQMRCVQTIKHWIDEDFDSLASLVHLRELRLHINEISSSKIREVADYQFLFELPQLTSLELEQTTGHPEYWSFERCEALDNRVKLSGNALGKVLTQLYQLKRLHFSGYIEPVTLAKLNHLEELHMGCCIPEIVNFDWIRSYRNLKSLKITTKSYQCDLSGIEELVALEELELFDFEHRCGVGAGIQFLSKLVNLKKLRLAGSHIHDFFALRGLQSLEVLTIESWCRGGVTKNLDVLGNLTKLRHVSLCEAGIVEVSVLAQLPRLRSVWLCDEADCAPLIQCDHPKLLRIFHRDRNCLWGCQH